MNTSSDTNNTLSYTFLDIYNILVLQYNKLLNDNIKLQEKIYSREKKIVELQDIIFRLTNENIGLEINQHASNFIIEQLKKEIHKLKD